MLASVFTSSRRAISICRAVLEVLEQRRLLDADLYEPNDTFATASDLGTVANFAATDLTIHEADNEDLYKFTAAATGQQHITILFDTSEEDLDLYVYDENEDEVDFSDGIEDFETVTLDVTEGDIYYIDVFGFEGATTSLYTLSIITPDRFEPNDDFAGATDLGQLGAVDEQDLTISYNNSDFFQFVAPGNGTAHIQIDFDGLLGDLDLYAYDQTESELASSIGFEDTESIDLEVIAGQTYYVEVRGFEGSSSPAYALTLSAEIEPQGGSISGKVFDDLDGDGRLDAGESGIEGRTVYLDLANDGVLNGADPTTLTDIDGNYSFGGLEEREWKVRQILPAGWTQTTPSRGYGWRIPLAQDQNVTDKNFGAIEGGSISGRLFSDRDGDGRFDSSENGIAGRTVYIDANNDGDLDAGERTTTTDANGFYVFGGVGAAEYKIRQILPSGWRQTIPTRGFGWRVPLAAGQLATLKDFGSTSRVLISGTVFNDLDGSGTRNSGEGGLFGWRIFIDANNDGTFNSGEKSSITNSSGNWSFLSLAPGFYRVRIQQLNGWTRTTPASSAFTVTLSSGQTSVDHLFGEMKVV